NQATPDESTVFEISSSKPSAPLAAPVAGVITSWRLNLLGPETGGEVFFPRVLPQTLKVLRPIGTTKSVQVVGESSGLVGSGANAIPARIPVQPGDRLGLFGNAEVVVEGSPIKVRTLLCFQFSGEPVADVIGQINGNPANGSTVPYIEGA